MFSSVDQLVNTCCWQGQYCRLLSVAVRSEEVCSDSQLLLFCICFSFLLDLCNKEKLVARSREHGATGPSVVSPSLRKPHDKFWIPKGLWNFCCLATQLLLVLCNRLNIHVQHLAFCYVLNHLWFLDSFCQEFCQLVFDFQRSWPLKYLGL